MTIEDNSNKTHLGDGAYAIYNGYNVELCNGHHNNVVLTLELPEGLDNLNKFVEQQKALNKPKK
jgi:hypothetical protein